MKTTPEIFWNMGILDNRTHTSQFCHNIKSMSVSNVTKYSILGWNEAKPQAARPFSALFGRFYSCLLRIVARRAFLAAVYAVTTTMLAPSPRAFYHEPCPEWALLSYMCLTTVSKARRWACPSPQFTSCVLDN